MIIKWLKACEQKRSYICYACAIVNVNDSVFSTIVVLFKQQQKEKKQTSNVSKNR